MQEIYAQAEALLHGESDAIANAANLSALIYNFLPNISWAGFYFYKEDMLVLGPFQANQPAYVFPWAKVFAAPLLNNKKPLLLPMSINFPAISLVTLHPILKL